MNFYWWSLVIIAVAALTTVGAEPAWEPVATELLQREKTGFGGLCGIVVDHANGDVWVNLSDRGMFLSRDSGRTWKPASDHAFQGRTETPGCWLLDPTGKSPRMLAALVYGVPLSISDDRAATWRKADGKSGHIDWAAADWTDPELKFILALKHEADGLLLASRDGGKSFAEVGKGYGTGWIFDHETGVVAEAKTKTRPRPVLQRTTNGGRTWMPCGEFSPAGVNSAQALPKWIGDRLYWLTDQGLIATSDQGANWTKVGEPKDGQYGPIPGRNQDHFWVLTKAGPIESLDGGKSWSPPIAPPPELRGIGGLSWLEYDPQRDTLFLMKMGSDLYRLKRSK